MSLLLQIEKDKDDHSVQVRYRCGNDLQNRYDNFNDLKHEHLGFLAGVA